ncbi:hypothetical protein JQV27_14870 [Sulfitobacter mediterraneus]|uniref:hypothetical protein n=1 Tax=Sulfitobacter mediterraneus TaxID=83219 RepID=UPI001932B223|nr:hypothetical protein [Sulfitobacter mediterraneus]MBM1633562.1 hypothetical protein [Sulfitobacter mediterraneus]MBM1641923.1 hypothetical protein [Sulfitobacter mediterraneus]MBM1645426.1 hypothetical protein [Sulfitobacter mediterraneus]MBM1650042.1 hypothetical protein [Sulfitobacter mediterraneus]MBM1653495.1 hypothetical protein [Sulfitobacter mediterraneus]
MLIKVFEKFFPNNSLLRKIFDGIERAIFVIRQSFHPNSPSRNLRLIGLHPSQGTKCLPPDSNVPARSRGASLLGESFACRRQIVIHRPTLGIDDPGVSLLDRQSDVPVLAHL